MSIQMLRIDQSRLGPRLICDQCLGVIERTADGSAEWHPTGVNGEIKVFFTHNYCTRAFRAARGGQAGWQWARLEDFHFWLAKNLGMRVEVQPGAPLQPYSVHGEILDVGASRI